MFVHNIQKTGLFSEIRKVIQKVLRLLLWKIYNFIIWVSLSFTKNIFQIIFGCVIWVWGEFRFFSIGDIEQLFKSGHSISISQKIIFWSMTNFWPCYQGSFFILENHELYKENFRKFKNRS